MVLVWQSGNWHPAQEASRKAGEAGRPSGRVALRSHSSHRNGRLPSAVCRRRILSVSSIEKADSPFGSNGEKMDSLPRSWREQPGGDAVMLSCLRMVTAGHWPMSTAPCISRSSYGGCLGAPSQWEHAAESDGLRGRQQEGSERGIRRPQLVVAPTTRSTYPFCLSGPLLQDVLHLVRRWPSTARPVWPGCSVHAATADWDAR